MVESYRLDDATGLDEGLRDLACQVNRAAAWSYRFSDGELHWSAGMAGLLQVDEDDSEQIRTRLLELVSPLIHSAETGQAPDSQALEEPFLTGSGEARSAFLRCSTTRYRGERCLIGIAVDAAPPLRDQRLDTDIADRYRRLIELNPDAVCVHQDGITVYVNPAGVRMMRASSPDEIVGHPITEFVAEHSRAGLFSRLSVANEPGTTTEPAEAEMIRVDGSRMLVESVAVRTSWHGRPAFQVILHDVTAQRAAEAALRYQAALVEHVSNAIIATTWDGVVTSWNPAAETIYGYSAEQARGRPVDEVVGSGIDPAALLTVGGTTEAKHRHADGSPVLVRISAAEMGNGYVLVCADETARRTAEQRYATVVSLLDEGVLIVDEGGRIVTTNPAAAAILGFQEEELLGSSPETWVTYDEDGERLPEPPSARTRHSGEPETRRVARFERRDGSSAWLAISARSLTPEDAPPHRTMVSFTDITEPRAFRKQLEREATHDPLTGLANRTMVLRRLHAAMREEGRTTPTGVMFIDLDKFKIINDSLGHVVGDEVLRVAGERLRAVMRSDEQVGRHGGDEFVVLVHDERDSGRLHALAERIRRRLTEPILVDGRHLHVDASIGIVLVPQGDPRTPEDVLRDADVAMYEAKTRGRGRVAFFDVQLRERLQRYLELEQDLRSAVDRGELWLAYQPIVNLHSNRVSGVEGLLRWTHPEHGTVSPEEFIPMAEESDLIHHIGSWVLSTAVQQVAEYRARFDLDLRVKANLSVRQLEDPGLPEAVDRALRGSGLPARALSLEITESALMHDPDTAAHMLDELRRYGVRLAIDDFGTGYSSLAQLLRLPLDSLKIDRSFINDIAHSHDSEALVTSIMAMAHAVDLGVIAEGVETPAQLAVLRRLGCDQAQGYYLGRPSPIQELPGTIEVANRRAIIE
ncbi:sensor domain-containing protein [Saccharopolyspora flava]|uniref:PAS domain S-box-containing protein/diguanylate cyclase (GGDEF) domain-containing protein n=1 Tax=Saccharopolyspora flava TaxID=95161 RepID=A0A1I6V7Y2_9PSEU|nr:EAL domain-containing protein [Saccharopolyspora flava]SFT09760.1 PAS domain S-box-containing protein/diguanylate cyclase (GGDEF) domain-containing protein [Saccharopolyspora flava]